MAILDYKVRCKCVIPTNGLGVDVARGICHSINAKLVIHCDGLPLGNDHVVVQIAELLLEDNVFLEYMPSTFVGCS